MDDSLKTFFDDYERIEYSELLARGKIYIHDIFDNLAKDGTKDSDSLIVSVGLYGFFIYQGEGVDEKTYKLFKDLFGLDIPRGDFNALMESVSDDESIDKTKEFINSLDIEKRNPIFSLGLTVFALKGKVTPFERDLLKSILDADL
ncbi:MAG: hypothetical protein K5694_03075 [Bacilli bacterium]|nr:hypothetical protein [Bacilli bacterium]